VAQYLSFVLILAFMVVFVLGIGLFGGLLWLAVPNKYTPVPTEADTEEDKISMFSGSTSATAKTEGDTEEYHCGWVYLTFEYREFPAIDLAMLQAMRGGSRPTGVYFMILHRSSLFLYDSEAQDTCLGVTSVDSFRVDVFPHDLLLDDIYRKDCPLRITNPTGSMLGSGSSSCFVYAANGSEKEDWLFALRRATGGTSLETEKEREKLDFTGFMTDFESQLGSQETDGTGQLMSALIARIMFNIHHAAEVETLIRSKWVQRTESLPKPFFMGDLILEDIDIGRSAPIISNGRLHSLRHNGELVGSLDFYYPGGLNLRISTQITSPVTVPIVVAVSVKKLAGRVMVKIKGPPSDRLWFGFYRLPDYDISVDPVVSNVAITWSFVQSAIMKKIEAALLEFVVLPNMTDLAIPPLVSGSLFVGERPFELEPVPPTEIAKIVDVTAYSAEGLSRRSPSVIPLTSEHELSHETLERMSLSVDNLLLRPVSRSGVVSQAQLSNRKIFVAMTEKQLGAIRSPLLGSLVVRDEPSEAEAEEQSLIHSHQD
jgi:hypothetical protein